MPKPIKEEDRPFYRWPIPKWPSEEAKRSSLLAIGLVERIDPEPNYESDDDHEVGVAEPVPTPGYPLFYEEEPSDDWFGIHDSSVDQYGGNL